jgi:hypothetical protein
MSSLVYNKQKNGVTYVYENTSTWNKETKRCDTKRKCVGKLDPDTGEVVPTGKRGPGGGKAGHAQVRCTGPGLLLDKAAEETGVARALEYAFPEEWKKVLTCAYHLVSERSALSHVETWSARSDSPNGETLTSQRVSELLVEMTREKQMRFYRQWVARRSAEETEYVAVDITSVSSYSKGNAYVRYGYNRDKEELPQINLCMLLGEESGLPLYCEHMNGSINDVKSLLNILAQINWMEAKGLHAVMDKGFYSEANIDGMYERHVRFTVGVPFTAKWAKELAARVRGSIEGLGHYHRVGDGALFADTDTGKWKGHRCYRHIFYDSKKAVSDYSEFLAKADKWREELQEGRPVQGNQAYYDRYFTVAQLPKRGVRVVPRDDAIQEYRQSTAGFFVLMSNDIKDPMEALRVYRNKDAVEKGFDNMKNALDMKRLRIHSPEAMEGRLFIQFIAQILAAQLRRYMADSGLDRSYSLPEMMNEMKSLHRVSLDGHRAPVFSPASKSQSVILSALAIPASSYV